MKNKISKVILFVLLAFVLAAAIFFLVLRIINHTNGEITSSGEKRTYLLYVPDSYDPAKAVPLVVSIHGYAEWPKHMQEISHWNTLADEYGFIVVYPSGTGLPLRWSTSGQKVTDEDPLRDVVFISDLLEKLMLEYNIDAARVYVNGFSNGGGMSFLLSCQLSDRIAAIGTVAGAYMTEWEKCKPERAVPVITFHGTDDPVVPYHGGPSRSFDLPFPDIPLWVDTLSQQNGCSETVISLETIGVASGIGYSDCSADVIFYTLDGSGHTWPGGKALPEWLVGNTSDDVDATRLMWAFFEDHPLERE